MFMSGDQDIYSSIRRGLAMLVAFAVAGVSLIGLFMLVLGRRLEGKSSQGKN